MRSLREKSFKALIKGKTMGQIIEICTQSQASLDSCFPSVDDFLDLINDKMPGCDAVLSRRYDMSTIEDYLEFAKALLEGRCNKYGISTSFGGTPFPAQTILKPFYVVEPTEETIVSKLVVDGHPPKPGTGCCVIQIISDDGVRDIEFDFYPFPVLATSIDKINRATAHGITMETCFILARKLISKDTTDINLLYDELNPADPRNRHFAIQQHYDDLSIVDLIFPEFEEDFLTSPLPRIVAIDDAVNETNFYIEIHFRFF